MSSAPAVGLTTAQLFTRARDPRTAFESEDPQKTGRVNIDGAMRAFNSIGVKLNLTEARALLLQQVGGDRGVPVKSLDLDYNAFLSGIGATAPRSAHVAVVGDVPTRAAGVAASIAKRMVDERGGVASEGWKVQLNDEPIVSSSRKMAFPGKKQVCIVCWAASL
jgi:hypothetical protein